VSELDACPLSGVLQTQTGHRLKSKNLHIIGLVQRSKHDPLLDHLVGAGAKAPPRVASAK
jgi:hypothetical protein